jgi:putative ABC transport system permease protein
MFHNYLITALRNLTRHKLYSFINIAGLTVGLTCAIFIILFVRDQLSYDRWIPGTENLYRVERTIVMPGVGRFPGSGITYPLPEAMLEQIPEVRARTRLIDNQVTILVGSRQFHETIDSVDPNFFQMVQLPLVAGGPASVFAEPNSVVLSEARARKYFGGAPAMGKTIIISASYCDKQNMNCQVQQHALTLTGILRDLPHNTQLAVDLVMPNTSVADPTDWNTKTNWGNTSGWGYVLLAPGADPNQVMAKIRAIIDHSFDTRTIGLAIKASEWMVPRLTPFRDDHLSTDQYGGMTPAGSWTTVYGFAAIGVLILLVACFNFTNLATARAMMRAREISLRKVVGAARGQLIIQFLGESVLIAMIALVLALALSEILSPLFDRFVNAPIAFDYFRDWPILLLLVGVGIAVGLVSGAYPALVLSGIRPGLVLRTNSARQSGSGLLRTSLVVLQFAVSIGLGIAVLVVFAQISFARHVDLGFHKDGVVVIDGSNLSVGQRESLTKALRAGPGITGAVTSERNAVPFSGSVNNQDVTVPGNPSTLTFWAHSVGPDYPQVFGVRLLAGRLLSEQQGADTVKNIQMEPTGFSASPYNILVNETGARLLGYSATSAVGKTIKVHRTQATIVGVIADIKMEGANQPTEPRFYRYVPSFGSQIAVRVRGEHLADTLAFIDRTWHAFAPSTALERRFLNDDFEQQFLAEDRQGDIFGLFVGIAIFIAALGLFGLAAFSTERRTKEIGLRKTFGAKTKDIFLMLLWQFSIPVLIANVIAWPVAYYYLHGWLEGYAYRIPLSPLYFVGAGAVALVIAWATVIVHAAHVARANPVHALRYE